MSLSWLRAGWNHGWPERGETGNVSTWGSAGPRAPGWIRDVTQRWPWKRIIPDCLLLGGLHPGMASLTVKGWPLVTHKLLWEPAGGLLNVWLGRSGMLQGLTWASPSLKKNCSQEWECWAAFFDFILRTISDLNNAFKGLLSKFPQGSWRKVAENT